VRVLAAVLVPGLLLAVAPAPAQQVPDTTFDTRVAAPGWPPGTGPRLLLDEAHHNFHRLDGRYRPFGDLARHDGFRVAANPAPFTSGSLAGQDVLVIANAMGSEDMSDSAAALPAFTAGEIAAVLAWVEAGGGLLLIADHAPFGGAAGTLARAFDVDMRSAYTIDPLRAGGGNPSLIPFSIGRGLDSTHAIVRGRRPGERVRIVKTFTGQSLAGPPGSTALLALSDSAQDLMVSYSERQRGSKVPPGKRWSAAGRAQGLAFTLGRGRVVVLGEAAMMSAQIAGRSFQMGMNQPGNDNKQFALNTLRWLAKLLE